MSNIIKSASKLVLLYVIGILGLLALFAGIWGVVHADFSDVIKTILSLFASALSFVMGFYFGYKGDTPPGTSTTVTKVEQADTPPFAGK